jgi:hypothetical protein
LVFLLAVGCDWPGAESSSESRSDPLPGEFGGVPVESTGPGEGSGESDEGSGDAAVGLSPREGDDWADGVDGVDGVVLPDGAREVQLSVNGERFRVVRPSLANPFVVAGSEFEDGPAVHLTEVGGPGAPQLEHAGPVGTIDVIRRVPQRLFLRVTNDAGMGDILGYYVQFEGYEGHFFVPTDIDSEVYDAVENEQGRIELAFFMDEVFPPGVERDLEWAARYNRPFEVSMTVWATDRNHRVSRPVSQTLHVLPVGRGDLEVTLSMSLPSDLDLYVVEPNGNVIYYNNMHSFTQGQLDLDANAACSNNTNVRYEHIFWPEGQVPEGTYQIRVDNWANCVGGQAVDYQVIVQNCGDITVYEGRAVGPGGRSDCVNPYTSSCQRTAVVEVRPCEP